LIVFYLIFIVTIPFIVNHFIIS